MADYNINLTIQSIWSVFRIVIDIAIMWFLFYYAIKAIRNNSRTIQIFKGIIAIVAVNGLAKLLGLQTLTYFTDIFINWGLLACIIIFQPEIRALLEKIGKSNAFSRINSLLANEKERLVEQVYEATITLSKSRTGALITIEQSQSLQDYIKNGNILHSVNYPDVSMPRSTAYRICVLHRNIPDVLSKISGAFAGNNIESQTNRSKGDLAYTILDLDNAPNEENLEKVKAIDGFIRMRMI